MSLVERLVASIVHFLGEQLRSDHLTADTKESLEVAIQCLESAYNISSSDVHLVPSQKLLDIFNNAVRDEPIPNKNDDEVSQEDKAEAERLKTEGNNLMKAEKYEEALSYYTNAIKLDPKNAVFYCNRAAAYSKLNQHTFALEDCKRAIEIDPNYSKAYGRMGLAFSSLNDHYQAKYNYKRAVELDPSNESYAANLKIAEEKVAELENSNPMASLGNLGSLFANPAMMNMAHQLLQDPQMQNLMGGLIGNTFGARPNPPQAAPESGSTSTADSTQPSATSNQNSQPTENPGGAPLFDDFIRMGQQLAAQVEATNPELVQQLRRRFGDHDSPNDNNNTNTDSNA